MERRAPTPVCKAFLICGQIIEDPTSGDTGLIALPTSFQHHKFPTARMLGFFTRWTSAHGNYLIEVQLQDQEGRVVWQEGPPTPLSMGDPLRTWDLKLNLSAIFPAPGAYYFVLTANGEEISRQQFLVHLTSQSPDGERST